MSSPEKKRKKEKELLLLSLPDELLFSCIARVSRFQYPRLSLVSKRFRSLIASPELYKVRSLLNLTESCLYICINIDHEYRWFILSRKKPNHQTLTNDKKSSGYVLSPVLIPRSPPSHSMGLVTVGYNIYSFAGSNASILDCRTHTWTEAPVLPVKELELRYPSVIDEKIYVAGRYKDGDANLVVVFDTKTQMWDPVPIPCSEIQDKINFRSVCIDGEFYMTSSGNMVAHTSKGSRWEEVIEGNMRRYEIFNYYCVIENVLYDGLRGKFNWYDTEARMWKELKGLVGLPKFPTIVKLADYGGKMAVLCYKSYPYSSGSNRVIWCGEIALERRRESCEIWGKVEWFDHLLTFDKSSHQFLHVVKLIAATF